MSTSFRSHPPTVQLTCRRPLSLLFLACHFSLLPNAHSSKQGHSPLHLYIISPFLPEPTQSLPLRLSIPHLKKDLNVIICQPPLPLTPWSKQSSRFSLRDTSAGHIATEGDHNKITNHMRDTLEVHLGNQISMRIPRVADTRVCVCV